MLQIFFKVDDKLSKSLRAFGGAKTENTKGENITVQLTSCLTSLHSSTANLSQTRGRQYSIFKLMLIKQKPKYYCTVNFPLDS